jgi:hypothetical protein
MSVDRLNRDTVMSFIVTAYAETENYSAAVKATQAIQEPQYRSGAFFEIAKAQSRTGDLAGALALASETQSAVEKSYALIGAAEGLLE